MNKKWGKKLIYSKMNKKGFFLAEETMKVLLAVICLLFLIFVLGKMYYSYSEGKEVQQAKDTLSRIEKEINSMKDGEKKEIILYGPPPKKGFYFWILTSFNGQVKPVFCNEKKWENCLCICKDPTIKTLIEKCDEDEVCVNFPNEKLSSISKDLKDFPIVISVKKEKGLINFS